MKNSKLIFALGKRHKAVKLKFTTIARAENIPENGNFPKEIFFRILFPQALPKLDEVL